MQARYNTAMETTHSRRRRKLENLAAQYAAEGGLLYISEQCGISEAALTQIIKGTLLPRKADGTRSPRGLGDRNARQIEARLGLGEGWFDASDGLGELSPDAAAIAEAFNALPADTPEQLAMRQRLYWAVMGLISSPAPAQPSTQKQMPVAKPSAERHRSR